VYVREMTFGQDFSVLKWNFMPCRTKNIARIIRISYADFVSDVRLKRQATVTGDHRRRT